MTERIQLSRAKGWRMPENTVKVDRTSRWGNPYRVAVFGLQRSIKLFENTVHGFWVPSLFDGDPDHLLSEAYKLHCAFRKRHQNSVLSSIRHELAGKNLGCWCAKQSPCHADILLALAKEPS